VKIFAALIIISCFTGQNKWYQAPNGKIYRNDGTPEYLQNSISWNSNLAKELRRMQTINRAYPMSRRYFCKESYIHRCWRCGAVN